jgi:hypothetical protein
MPDIIDQLNADIADHAGRIASKRRMRGDVRYYTTELHRAFLLLTDLGFPQGAWARDDLIRLVDHALAAAAAEDDPILP